MVSEREPLQRSGSLFGHGIVAGAVAGTLFAVAEILAAALMGLDPLGPVRMFASLILGRTALDLQTPLAVVVPLGLLAHYLVACGWGGVYAGLLGTMGQDARSRVGFEAVIGLVFGTAVWLVNFHLIGRAMYPWFLETSQQQQWLLHALFYGFPVGLTFTAMERARPSQPVVPVE
jgi:hypothetical protein